MTDETLTQPPGLDLAVLRAFLDRTCPGLVAGPLTATLIAGGKSNLTYRVSDGNRTVIVRRPPLGHVLATAHDMAREYRMMTGLRGTAVPVPRTWALCEDTAVLGVPFYVMEEVPGTPYRSAAQLRPLGAERTRTITGRAVDTLAALHRIHPDAVGLSDLGRPDGFLERQVRRWTKQLGGSRSRDLAGADELPRRLAERIPPVQPPAIVHGDYRLDNLLVDAADRVVAVLDWEMATIGDPLTDVAMSLVYEEVAHLDTGIFDASLAPGFVGGAEFLDRYASHSGRDLTHLPFYVGLACFKLAVILEGIHYRHEQGGTAGEGFDSIGTAVQPLLDMGLGRVP